MTPHFPKPRVWEKIHLGMVVALIYNFSKNDIFGGEKKTLRKMPLKKIACGATKAFSLYKISFKPENFTLGVFRKKKMMFFSLLAGIVNP